MFDIFCSLFSNTSQPGQYAYESFRKVPSLSVLTEKTPQVVNLSDNLFQFTNNVPQQSIKASDQNLQKLMEQSDYNRVIKKIMKSNYSQLIAKHRQSSTMFTDPDFPPSQSSIGKVQSIAINAQWRRISDVVKGPVFVSGNIDSNDILQGSIGGGCYFLSAISALAEYDFRIKNLFADLTINPYGIYMAKIMHQGVLREVVVDDYIPVTQQGVPMFAKPVGGKQIWVMILQKCWAKLHGSYGAIVGGLPNQVLHAFSGAPTLTQPINHTSKQKQQTLWNDLVSANSSGSILCCCTKGQLSSVQKAGLIVGHAYSMLNIYHTTYSRLVKLRNPCGNKQWTGRASAHDTQFWSGISPGQKQLLGYTTNGNNSTFFILWQDFVSYFDIIDICKINDNANYINVDMQFDRKRGEMFDFATDGGDVVVTLSQQAVRAMGDVEEKWGLARSTVVVARYEQTAKGFEYTYIESSSSRLYAQHILQLNKLAAGRYLVFAKFDWIRKHNQPATISLYTSSAVTLTTSSQSAHSQFLYRTFLDHSRHNPNKHLLSQHPLQWVCSEFLLNKCGYGYLTVHLDEKSTKNIGVQINQKQYTQRRLTLKKPYKGRGVIKLIVEPGKQCIVLFRLKAHSYPLSITLPTPKIYYLV